MVAVRIILAVLEQPVVHNKNRLLNNEPHEGHILGIPVGKESVDFVVQEYLINIPWLSS